MISAILSLISDMAYIVRSRFRESILSDGSVSENTVNDINAMTEDRAIVCNGSRSIFPVIGLNTVKEIRGVIRSTNRSIECAKEIWAARESLNALNILEIPPPRSFALGTMIFEIRRVL
jgi:hypothetical protein